MSVTPQGKGVRQLLSALRAPGVTKFAPLAGLASGALAAAVYWLAVQLWPSSVALILSVLTGALLADDIGAAAAGGVGRMGQLFYVLLKYNVLMALSAAKLPFDAPLNTALCLIIICGCGAARSLLVCLPASRAGATPRLSHLDLGVALLLGFAPALLLGMPGLIGLAAVVAAGLGLTAAPRGLVVLAPWIAETCFYLGAQASWRYI
jgi:cobalamin synthase